MYFRLAFALLASTGAAALVLASPASDDSLTLTGAPPTTADLPVVIEPDQAPPGIPPDIAARMAAARGGGGGDSSDSLPKFEDIAKGFTKVSSTTDGSSGLYTLWKRDKDAQLYAELPRNFERQKLFIAYTVAGGIPTAGVQTGDMYAYWKRFDNRLALIEPNYAVRSSGDQESRGGLERVFTDRVILDVPIAANGSSGGPVIDLDGLLLGQASRFFGYQGAGANASLAEIQKAKSFPQNVEVAFKLPLAGGKFGSLAYSISVLPERTGYQSREADARVGYFTTTHRDIGDPGKDTPWVRYINRWKLEKADPKLKMSPPKEPIVFYLEHTIPIRYRRWVRDGVLEWNKAFEKVGIVSAIEVYQQDARTGAHMDKDPEDARYNFLLWTNANMGFAIGPSRVDPRTGQILDADIVMDEGFITSWVNAWKKVIPETAMLNFGPETLAWLQTRPQWDPRIRLAAPAERQQKIHELSRTYWAGARAGFAGNPAASADPTLLGDDRYDGLAGRISQVNGRCEYATATSFELALLRLNPDLFVELAARSDDEDDDVPAVDGDDNDGDDDVDEDADGDDEEDDADDDDAEDDEEDEKPVAPAKPATKPQMLDGVPEWFVGPLLKSVVMHEVGHTLGLRHNFKASTIHSLAEINSADFDGTMTGSVMDYNPININFEDGDRQGPYTMDTIGPYDYWAIEYGYTFERKLDPILKRVTEPELAFGTDEDSWGSDPDIRVFDLGRDSLDYADSQMRLVKHLRGAILDRMVKDGESWAKAREGYELLLSRHMSAIAIAANWLGGANTNRDMKGDSEDRVPVSPVSAEQQERALQFVIDNAFSDDAYGLTPELLSKMTLDKWYDAGGFNSLFEDRAWPVHERILGMQAATLTMLMNPGTLGRIYDNEFRVPSDEPAVTLPEFLASVTNAVWSELGSAPTKKFTARKPMVSSLRRNLQREHLMRLIDLTLPNSSFGVASKPVATLSTHMLRELDKKIASTLQKSGTRLDPYTTAHLSEAQVRIEKALDASYIYNTNDIGGGSALPSFLFGEENDGAQHAPR